MEKGITTRGLPTELLEGQAPFVSVFLDTEVRSEDAPRNLELRWQDFRRRAAGEGAPEAALAAIDAVVEGAHARGDGLAAVATEQGLLLHRHLASPLEDSFRVGSVPHVAPLLEWQQDNPFYAVVLADRIGAEIHLIHPARPDESIAVEGEEEPIQRVKPGGWSQRRFQQRAENLWEKNATLVSDALDRLATTQALQVIVLSGDVRAIGFLKEHASERVGRLLVDVEEQARTIEDITADIQKAVAAHVGFSIEEKRQKFLEERGQRDLAADGWGATAAALRKAQVDTLLIQRRGDDRTAAIVDRDPRQISLDRGELEALDAGEVVEVDGRDGLVWAALAGGAEVCLLPDLPEDQGPKDGVGAILRFT